jgi:hypothetical protein
MSHERRGNMRERPGWHHPTETVREVQNTVEQVARQDLVCSLAGEHDLHVLSGQTREQERRQRDRISQRFVGVPDDLRQPAEIFRLAHHPRGAAGWLATARASGVSSPSPAAPAEKVWIGPPVSCAISGSPGWSPSRHSDTPRPAHRSEMQAQRLLPQLGESFVSPSVR